MTKTEELRKKIEDAFEGDNLGVAIIRKDTVSKILEACQEAGLVFKVEDAGLPLTCPRCGSRDFREVDCGPDSYDDDISYTSDICEKCGLWHDGWVDKWFADVEYWQKTEDAEEYKVEIVAVEPLIKEA